MQTFTKWPAQKVHVRPATHAPMSVSTINSKVNYNFLWAMHFCVICLLEQARVLKTEMGGKFQMEMMSLWAWTSDRLAARRLVIIKRLPLVSDKQEEGSMSTVSSLCCDGYNKCFVLWQSPACVVLHYMPLLLSTNWMMTFPHKQWSSSISTLLLQFGDFFYQCRRRNSGLTLQTIFFTFSGI